MESMGLEIQLRSLERCLDDLDAVVACKRKAQSVREAWLRSVPTLPAAPAQPLGSTPSLAPPSSAAASRLSSESAAEIAALKAERDVLIERLKEAEILLGNREEREKKEREKTAAALTAKVAAEAELEESKGVLITFASRIERLAEVVSSLEPTAQTTEARERRRRDDLVALSLRVSEARDDIAERAATCAHTAELLEIANERARAAEEEAIAARAAAASSHARANIMEGEAAAARAGEEVWRKSHSKLEALASSLQRQLAERSSTLEEFKEMAATIAAESFAPPAPLPPKPPSSAPSSSPSSSSVIEASAAAAAPVADVNAPLPSPLPSQKIAAAFPLPATLLPAC